MSCKQTNKQTIPYRGTDLPNPKQFDGPILMQLAIQSNRISTIQCVAEVIVLKVLDIPNLVMGCTAALAPYLILYTSPII